MALWLAATTLPAEARDRQSPRRAAQPSVNLNQAVQQAQQQSGGRVLSADTVSQGGRAVHRVKVLTPSGEVRVYTIDAGGGR
jgi:uncharacterized membrane protein YkoI